MSAKVEINGYVKKPEAKAPDGKKAFNQFQLACKTGKDPTTGKGKYTYFQCRDYRADRVLPKDDTYVVVKGGLNVYTTEREGKVYTNFQVFVDSVDNPDNSEPAKEEPKATPAATPAKDPWDE